MSECETCYGAGALIVRYEGRWEVQRCDKCKVRKDDKSAWRRLQPQNRKK